MTLYTVIGARGFIGSRLASSLKAAGAEVYAPARDDAGLWERDLGRVLYCAGLTGDYRTRPFEAVEAHTGLVSRLLERARFERFVYLSSTRLYQTGRAASGREDARLNLDPNDPEQVYEFSKALGENLTVNRSGGRGVAARVAYVFDWEPGAAGFLSEWLLRAREARDIAIASTPQDGRDYIHLDDVARALAALADSDAGGVVNVASGQVTTNAEIAQVFAQAGWRVSFTGQGASAPPPELDVGRLETLGVRARPPLELIETYLRSL